MMKTYDNLNFDNLKHERGLCHQVKTFQNFDLTKHSHVLISAINDIISA